MMRQWDLVYGKQPAQLDAILLALALALHTPLVMLHMKAPPKVKKGKVSRMVNIDFIEQQIQKRKEKPVVLPPKIPETPKDIKNLVKKVEAVKKQVFKRSLPPPPPAAPKIPDQLLKGPDPTKLNSNLQDKLNAEKKVLQGKNGFQGRDMKLAGPNAAKELKIGGGASSIQTNSRMMAGPQGGTLQGKSGFQVSQNAMPMSIGGDDGAIKMGGDSNIVVVPVGARAKADASILSPTVRDKGSLQAAGPAGIGPGSSGANSPGLAGGGAAASIATGGGRPAMASAGPAVKTGKTLNEGALGNPGMEAAKTPASSTLPVMPRRAAPKVQKPMFLITGPLANRKVLSRQVPEYPEWARAKGIEAAVVLQFTVTPEGDVKNNVFVVRTSGYPQMDELAAQALKKWKFVPLPSDQLRDEVGTITFNFSIR